MIKFDPTQHKYTDETGAEYISATTLIKKFCEPFEDLVVATRYAEKNGETPEYWLNKWAEKRDASCFKGSRFHKMKEDVVSGRGIEVRGFGEIFEVRNHELEFMKGSLIENLPDGVYLEMPLWNETYKVSGTPDKAIVDRKDFPYVDIDDYKTNEEIKLKSFQFKSGKFKMMLGPLRHLMDCNYTHYCLQLSLYAYMYECFGYKPRKMQILHYNVDPMGEPIDPKPTVYEVPYLKKEVLLMLEHLRQNGPIQLKYGN